eukprot:265627-Hanusia_phi.AAC.1
MIGTYIEQILYTVMILIMNSDTTLFQDFTQRLGNRADWKSGKYRPPKYRICHEASLDLLVMSKYRICHEASLNLSDRRSKYRNCHEASRAGCANSLRVQNERAIGPEVPWPGVPSSVHGLLGYLSDRICTMAS